MLSRRERALHYKLDNATDSRAHEHDRARTLPGRGEDSLIVEPVSIVLTEPNLDSKDDMDADIDSRERQCGVGDLYEIEVEPSYSEHSGQPNGRRTVKFTYPATTIASEFQQHLREQHLDLSNPSDISDDHLEAIITDFILSIMNEKVQGHLSRGSALRLVKGVTAALAPILPKRFCNNVPKTQWKMSRRIEHFSVAFETKEVCPFCEQTF